MKITDAWIDDPTLRNELEASMLCIELDEKPYLTDSILDPKTGWITKRYGYFFQFVVPRRGDNGEEGFATAAEWNTIRGPLATLDPMVDVTLFFEGESDRDSMDNVCLALGRARSILKRHESNWRFYLSELQAREGRISWMPVEVNGPCRHWTESKMCESKPTRPTRIKNLEVPLCQAHQQEQNAMHAAKRRGESS